MTSVLIVTDRGLDVRRFAHANHALLAQAPIESDGLPAVLVRRVCAWCKTDMGVAVGSPGQENAISHGMCPSCQARIVAELPGVSCAVSSATAGRDRHSLVPGERLESVGQEQLRCGSAPADAGLPAPSPSRATGANAAAAVPATTPPGDAPSQVTGTAGSAGIMNRLQAVEYARACPAASSDLKPRDRWRPARGVIEFLDGLLKWAVTGRRIDE